MNLTRRTLLQGFGTAIALPWLESMAVATGIGTSNGIASIGQTAKPPVRTAFVYLPNGMNMSHWRPALTDVGEKLTTPRTFEPVAKYLDQTTIISGLSLRGAEARGDGAGDHARSVAAFLTGAHPRKTQGSNIHNGVSVDQVAASKIGHHTRFPSLEFGTESSAQAGRCDSGYSCAYTSNISWRTPTSPMAKEMDPSAVFERLFGSSSHLDSAAAKQQRKSRRKSILDFVRRDAKSLQFQLSTNDRHKFDEYMFSIRDIEKRLGDIDKLAEPEVNISDFQRPLGVPASYGEHVKLMLDMMALAFQTDSTRVISFMFANAGSNRSYREIGIKGGHHDISHHGNAIAKRRQISKINLFHMELFGHLLDRLSSIREGDSTLLDNSMILYGSGISDGNKHTHKNLPIAIFGRGGGTIDAGRHIRVRGGTPLTNLYCSMLDRVGAKVDTFSDSNGRIDQLKIS